MRNYQRLWIVLTNNRQTYHPIAQVSFSDEEDLSMVMATESELAEEDQAMTDEIM